MVSGWCGSPPPRLAIFENLNSQRKAPERKTKLFPAFGVLFEAGAVAGNGFGLGGFGFVVFCLCPFVLGSGNGFGFGFGGFSLGSAGFCALLSSSLVGL